MAHNPFPQWSQGNDGFGHHEPQRFDKTPTNPVIEAEARSLINMVANRCLPKWKREEAYKKLLKQYGTYLDPDTAEMYCSHDTESEASESEASESEASESEASESEASESEASDSDASDPGSDGSGSGSDGSGSEQCPDT